MNERKNDRKWEREKEREKDLYIYEEILIAVISIIYKHLFVFFDFWSWSIFNASRAPLFFPFLFEPITNLHCTSLFENLENLHSTMCTEKLYAYIF